MEISKFIQKLENEIKSTQKEIEQIESLNRLKEIAKKYEGEDEVISTLDLAEQMKQRGEEYKILSGWTDLDKLLNGFRLGQLVDISAMTKSGKTSWCIDLTTRIRNENPLWFPFEEGGEELIQKFLDRGEEPPFFFLPKQNTMYSLEWLEQKIVESIAKHDTKVVFIDHLDFIVPFAGERQDLMIAKVCRELKQIAKKWNVLIFLIAHLKKAKMDSQPTLEDIRGSASIAQESDTVIMLWREMRKENGEVVITDNVNISVQANRRTGKTGNVKMVYNNGKFLEQDWSGEKQYQELTRPSDYD